MYYIYNTVQFREDISTVVSTPIHEVFCRQDAYEGR